MSLTNEQLESLLRQDAKQVSGSREVPDLHQSIISISQNSGLAAPHKRPRLRLTLGPLATAVAVVVVLVTSILLIQHNRTTHRATPAATRSARPTPGSAQSSSCAYGGVQASVLGHVPLSLLSCTGAAIGAYPGNNRLPAITVKVGSTVEISGAMLYQNSRLSLTPSSAASLTQAAAHQWRLVATHAGQITVEITSAGLCRNSQRPCGLLAVTVTR